MSRAAPRDRLEVCGWLMDAIIAAYEAKGQKLQMIDSTSVRVHQQAAAQKNRVEIIASVAAGED